MIIDKDLEFADSQDFAGVGAGVTKFTNDINLQKGGNAIVQNWFVLNVNETFDNLTSAQVEVITDDDPAFGSAEIIVTTPVLLLAELVGSMEPVFAVRLPYAVKQYLRARVTTVGAAPTVGKLSARLVQGTDLNDQFGYNG